MTEQWQELRETIIELRDNDGTATQQEVCKFLVNYMEVLEKQMQEPILYKIRAEIEVKYGNYNICEWFEDYDYEENDISEYQYVGDVSDILAIIDKYTEESER